MILVITIKITSKLKSTHKKVKTVQTYHEQITLQDIYKGGFLNSLVSIDTTCINRVIVPILQ